MKYRLKKHNQRLNHTVKLESSKSESNRALIINALAGGDVANLHNLSNARDTQTMIRLLSQLPQTYDVKDAGTTMRFLTAFLAVKGKGEVITGTDRMKQRPIGPLVDALRKLGAEITYMENEGYPPLQIVRIDKQKTSTISIPGNISSQYISALLMIAPSLPKGLKLTLTTEIYSRPYIQMTLDLMKSFGVEAQWNDNEILVASQVYTPTEYTIEGDWSGASYWYGFMKLAPDGSQLKVPSVRKHSSQGDNAIATIMNKIGIATHFDASGVGLSQKDSTDKELSLDFKDCPDLAQTVMVAAAASDITLKMTGLESLKIKETDRVAAMQTELNKIGADLKESGKTWTLIPSSNLPEQVEIETYEDHRMAMAFAPLSVLMDVEIDDPMVVEKSYPSFWKVVESLGVEIEEFKA